MKEKKSVIKYSNRIAYEYILPPMAGAASFSDLGASTTTTSAVVNNEATPLASCNAVRTTYKTNIIV
jgi:hypothetical protein